MRGPERGVGRDRSWLVGWLVGRVGPVLVGQRRPDPGVISHDAHDDHETPGCIKL